MAYSSITKPSDYFNTKLYTGTGATRSITGIGFQPDWIWTKGRSGTYDTESHKLYDAVRGTTKELRSDVTNAESTNSGGVTSFDSDGYGLGAGGGVNGASTEYVSWNWLAGGTPSSNTDGSITSSVSANTTAGFSIVSYTGNGTSGATVGHGLGSTPKMIIARKRNGAENWLVYHEEIGNSDRLLLNTTAAATTDNIWTSSPTSSVFSIHSVDGINGSGNTYIAYCFAEKKGYSNFGFYKGNGNANGPFVYTGFKPAFVMIKQTNTTGNWAISDNQRKQDSGNQDGGNGNFVPHMLAANLNNDEAHFGGGSGNKQDFLSNGFKIRDTGGYANTSGGSYIYMAFAEHPLVANVNGGLPATAR
jgi:hypothetical protein